MFRRRRESGSEYVDPALDFTDPADEAALEREVAAAQVAAVPVVCALRDAGLRDLSDIGDLVNQSDLYYRAQVPVLVEWLPRVDNLRVRATIVRALTEPWAKHDALDVMLREF